MIANEKNGPEEDWGEGGAGIVFTRKRGRSEGKRSATVTLIKVLMRQGIILFS